MTYLLQSALSCCVDDVEGTVAVMFPIMDMANKIIRNFDDKFHKLFISKVSAQ